MSYATLVDWLKGRVAATLGLTPAVVKIDVAFSDYGLDSTFALDLCVRLEHEFGILAEPTIAWDYPTIDAIARHLAEQPRAAS
jgi:acyl carrier protein